MKKFNKIIGFLALTIVFLAACEEEISEVDPGIAPQIPPTATMQPGDHMGSFTAGSTPNGRVQTQFNWGTAAFSVGVWNTVLAVVMVLPVGAFQAVINEEPTFDRDRQLWVWTKDFVNLGRTNTAELTASVSTTTVKWEMHVSQENGFQDFLWYYGETPLSGTEGFWVLRTDTNSDGNDALRIDWKMTGEDIGEVRYTNVNDADDGIGGYIEYGKIDNEDYNLFYNIHDAKEDNTLAIKWNDETGEGRLESDESGPLCWDTDFEDVDCL